MFSKVSGRMHRSARTRIIQERETVDPIQAGGNRTRSPYVHKPSKSDPVQGRNKQKTISKARVELDRKLEAIKNTGNKSFKAGNYEDAIEKYRECLMMDPNYVACMTNMALCWLKLERHREAIDICVEALKIDKDNIKANYRLGEALISINKFDEGLEVLERTLELCKSSNNMQDGASVSEQISSGKKKRWLYTQEQKENDLNLLKDFVNEAIMEKFERDEILSQNNEALRKYYTSQLDSLFLDEFSRIRRREVPQDFCCPISFSVMADPVITPSGITYERESILEHLVTVGKFDPVTREPLNERQLSRNLVLKKIIDEYIQKNEYLE